jgi:hypothetical protein
MNSFFIRHKNMILALALACICAAGFVIRAPMIQYGTPFLFHPDEYAIANAGLENVRFKRLDPHYYLYPMYSVYAYTIVDWLYISTNNMFHYAALPQDIKDLEPKDLYVINRGFSSFSLLPL